MLSVNFSLLIKLKKFFRYNFCLGDFCSVLFLIHDEYGIGLNVVFLINILRNGFLAIEV